VLAELAELDVGSCERLASGELRCAGQETRTAAGLETDATYLALRRFHSGRGCGSSVTLEARLARNRFGRGIRSDILDEEL